MKINYYIKITLQFVITLSILGFTSCGDTKKKKEEIVEIAEEVEIPTELPYKLSLAQWSFHKAIRDNKTMPILDFAKKAKELGFDGVEYVSQLYQLEKGNEQASLDSLIVLLKKVSDENDIQNVLIMIDHEGDLSVSDKAARDEAIRRHSMWVDAAAALGCHAVRVNLFGGDAEKDPAVWHANSVDGMGRLAQYAATKNINVIVENHGGLSSDAAKVIEVIKAINLPNCGTLPDFGNFCVKRASGERWAGECIEQYDIYKGTEELMAYAKGVSAKTYDFDSLGNETTINYAKMMDIIKKSGFKGFIGIEYEGNNLGEEEGIIKTKELVLKVSKDL